MDERTNEYPASVTDGRLRPQLQDEEGRFAGWSWSEVVPGGNDIETGDVLPEIGRAGNRRWFVLDHWVGVSEDAAVGFAEVEGATTAVGLVHYAPLTRTSVQALPIGEMVKPEPWMPRWDQPEAPGPDELRYEWAQAQLRQAQGAVMIVTSEADPKLERSDGKTPDEFYAEVAALYRRYQHTGKPTSWLALAGQVPYTTAARWVREARRRGHLEPAQERKK